MKIIFENHNWRVEGHADKDNLWATIRSKSPLGPKWSGGHDLLKNEDIPLYLRGYVKDHLYPPVPAVVYFNGANVYQHGNKNHAIKYAKDLIDGVVNGWVEVKVGENVVFEKEVRRA